MNNGIEFRIKLRLIKFPDDAVEVQDFTNELYKLIEQSGLVDEGNYLSYNIQVEFRKLTNIAG